MAARRSRGDGALFYDADRKCWVGSLSLGRDPVTRRRVRRKVSAPTKTGCKDKLDELRAAHRRTGTVPAGNLTVEAVVRELLDSPPDKWKSPQTIAANGAHGARLISELGKVRVTKLSVIQVERLLRSMKAEGLSASTIGRTRSILALALRRAERDHGLGRNVAALADLPGGTRRTSRAMRPAEIDKLMASDLSPWWRAWLTTALGLGLRPGELSGLRWEDVDFEAGILRVRHSIKGGRISDLKTEQSRRSMRMPAAVSAALKAQRVAQNADRLALGRAYHDLDLVFAREDGLPIHRDRVRTGLAAACQAAGIETYTPRETRHTFVSVMSDSGLDIEQIADAVGHVNSTVTKAVYRHQIRDEISTAATAWDALGSLAVGSPARLPEGR